MLNVEPSPTVERCGSWQIKKILPAVISSLLVNPATHAQDSNAFILEEILVTAQKKQESLQDVPIAVSAFSQDQLMSKGLLSGTDLKLSVPNVNFSDTGFAEYNFQIRGVGSLIIGITADSGVGIHTNNIPLQENRLPQAQYFDIDRVEVLRGPQGTLYGRNATGGVINVITAKPEHDFSAMLTAEYGSYDTIRTRGHINLPISDTLAFRLAGMSHDRDGNIDNLSTGNKINSRDLWATRASLKFEPTDNLSSTFIWEHFEQDDSTGGNLKHICTPDPGPASVGGVPTTAQSRLFLSDGCQNVSPESTSNNGAPNSAGTVPGLFAYLFGFAPYNVFEGATYSRDLHDVYQSVDPFLKTENDVYSVDITFDLNENLTLTSVTAFAQDESKTFSPLLPGNATLDLLPIAAPLQGLLASDGASFTADGVYIQPVLGAQSSVASNYWFIRQSEQLSQEIRIQSSFDGAFNVSVGGIYMDFESTANTGAAANTTSLVAHLLNATEGAGIFVEQTAFPTGEGHNYFNNASSYELTAAAVFGEAYYDISDTWKATLGLRYTRDEKKQKPYPIQLLQPGRGFPDVAAQETTFEEVTGRFTLDWLAFEDTMIYASVARGYKGGGFNPPAPEGSGSLIRPTFDPEFVDAVEIGSKSLLMDGRMSLNTSVFFYNYNNYQVSRTLNQTVVTENLDAQIKGLELESVLQASENLQLNATLGLLDSKIKHGQSIDTLNRLQGNTNYTQVRSSATAGFATTCLVPTAEVAGLLGAIDAGMIPPPELGGPPTPEFALTTLCSGPMASPNAIEGIEADLSGNELPYSPGWTLSIGGQYDINFSNDLSGSLRADYYVQDDSYARVYNSATDELDGYDNLNLSLRLESASTGLELLIYARNLLSEDTIVSTYAIGEEAGGHLLASGKERPMYGVAITKRWY